MGSMPVLRRLFWELKRFRKILRQLPRERTIAALDAVDGEVVVEGWRTKTGATILSKMEELKQYVGGFLITFVEREGRLAGTNMDMVAQLVEAAGDARVTIAGGVSTCEEIAQLDRLGADAQVGMAIYTDKISLADAITAPLSSDRDDGLWPTVVSDLHGSALGLCWSNQKKRRRSCKAWTGSLSLAQTRTLGKGREFRSCAKALRH